MEALDDPRLILQLGEDGLGPDDDVPDPLTGDAVVLRNLSQREVLVVVEVVELLLPVGEHIAVKVVKQGHAIGLIFQKGHLLRSLCKAMGLYNKSDNTIFYGVCQERNPHAAPIPEIRPPRPPSF